MALARRTRMVSIRLSDEEFEKLKGRSEQFGERTLSDIAREAMYRLLDSEPQPAPAHPHPDHHVKALEARINSLEYQVFRLNSLVETLSCKSS